MTALHERIRPALMTSRCRRWCGVWVGVATCIAWRPRSLPLGGPVELLALGRGCSPINAGRVWRRGLPGPFARRTKAIGPRPLRPLGGYAWESTTSRDEGSAAQSTALFGGLTDGWVRRGRTFWLLSVRSAGAHVASGAGRGVPPCRLGAVVPAGQAEKRKHI
jgi:hypothetical protein